MRRRVVSFACFVCVFGSLALPEASSAISNGTPVAPVPPWAAYITTNATFLGQNLWVDTICTGTIVAPDWVLTAAHCLYADSSSGATTTRRIALSKFRVVLGRSNLNSTWSGAQWTVDQAVPDPSYNPTASEDNDVALLHLHGALPSTATPLALNPSGYSLAEASTPTAYGYGDTSETYPSAGHPPYIGQTSTVLNATKPGSYQFHGSCGDSFILCMQYQGASEILHGDSGGPWVQDMESPNIAAITDFTTDFHKTGPDTGYSEFAGAANVAESGLHSWIATTAGLIAGSKGTIYRDSSTAASWLLEDDGFRHPIPDGGTYECLTAAGHAVVNLNSFTVDELPVASSDATCGGSRSSVLLYGDGDSEEDPTGTGFTNISNALTAVGFHVTILRQTSLPQDLTPYGQIWHYGIDVPSSADQQTLVSFARSGGSIYLTGERPCCEAENAADANIINSLVLTVGGIGVGGLGDIGSCSDKEAIDQGAEDGIATTPNALTTWHPQCPGGMSNVPPNNVFAASANGTPVAAIFDNNDVSGGGRLAILMDVNWAQSEYEDSATMPAVAQNIATFLAG